MISSFPLAEILLPETKTRQHGQAFDLSQDARAGAEALLRGTAFKSPESGVKDADPEEFMRSDTFRAWLAEHGCHFESHEPHGRSSGHLEVTVRCEGRTARLPLGGGREDLDRRIVKQICDELGLDASQLPGSASRV